MDKDILAEAKDAFAECAEAESGQRSRMLDDLRFARLGEQWPEAVRRQRELEGRPCLTVNRMPAFIRQVVNDARQNKPAIKVHPVDDAADVGTAKVLDGLIRNIESTSDADVAYDTGIDHAASMGVGYWRVGFDYARDDAFDQDLKILRVPNPFCVYGDPRSQAADSSDWGVAFVTELLKKTEFQRLHPGAETASWRGDRLDAKDALWFEGDDVRRAEYWVRSEVERKLLLLSDGTAVREEDFLKPGPETGFSPRDLAAAQNVTVVRDRPTKGWKVKRYLLAADDVLEASDWPGIYIPVIPCYGEEVNVEGRKYYLSLIHQAKDAQRMFNYWRTTTTELVALAPKAPYVGPKGAFNSDQAKWATANVKNYPYLQYDGGVMPQRQPFAGPPAGALQEALNAADDMKSIMGLHDASLGARSNETSGRAIMARQREGDVSTFHFVDNLSRAIRHTGRVLVDLIPHVYTAERVVRVLGEDGVPQAVTINTTAPGPDGLVRRVNDVTAGKYDLVVKAGPSFTSRREEAAFQMTEMIRSVPEAGPIIGPHLAKNLDWPGADEIAEELKLLSPAEQARKAAEAQAAGQPPQPDPRALEMEHKAELERQRFGLEVQKTRAQLEMEREKAAAHLGLEREKALAHAGMERDRMAAQLGFEREKTAAQMQLEREKAALHGQVQRDLRRCDMDDARAARLEQRDHEVSVNKMLKPEDYEDEMKQVAEAVTLLAQSVAQGNQALAQGMAAVIESNRRVAGALLAPKRLVTDADGRPVGVEPVINSEEGGGDV